MFLFEVARRFSSSTSNEQCVLRLQGDEFIILLSHVEEQRTGSNYLLYEPYMDKDHETLLLLENKLRKALLQNDLELYYQPKVHAQTGKMIGMEALIRWFNPDFGYISADKFIPIAEERRLISTIGEWTLVTACKQIEKWNALHGTSLRVVVNISATHFMQSSFVQKIRDMFQRQGYIRVILN